MLVFWFSLFSVCWLVGCYGKKLLKIFGEAAEFFVSESVGATKSTMGIFFFFVELKLIEFILEPWGNSSRLRVLECWKGYLWSISLGRGVFWLLSTVEDVKKIRNSVGFLHEFRDSQCVLLG